MAIDPGLAEHFRDIEDGMEAEAFLKGKIGKYAMKRTKEMLEENFVKLSKINPRAHTKISEIQKEINMLRLFPQFLNEMIVKAMNSTQVVSESERLED